MTVWPAKRVRTSWRTAFRRAHCPHRGWRDDFDRKINTLVEGQHQIHIKITTIAAYQDGLNASQRAPADQI